MENKFVVVYSFQIYEGKDEYFISSWKKLTELIYQNSGSLGSRLHKLNESEYIAYAIWPDRETFKDTTGKLPEHADEFRTIMRNACINIDIRYEMQIVADLIKSEPF